MPAVRKGGTPSPREKKKARQRSEDGGRMTEDGRSMGKKKARLVSEPGFVYKKQLSLNNEAPDLRRPERGQRSSYP